MTNAPTIVFEYGPAGNCPVQAEGTIDGRPFYFRARGMHLGLFVGSLAGGDPLAGDAWEYREDYPDASWENRFAAGWASPEECRQFIERAAKVWAAQQTGKPS